MKKIRQSRERSVSDSQQILRDAFPDFSGVDSQPKGKRHKATIKLTLFISLFLIGRRSEP